MMFKMMSEKRAAPVLVALATLLLVLGPGCTKESRSKRYLARAEADLKAERYEAAEIGYIAALRENPSSAAAAAGLGLAYCEQGKVPQAFGALTRALELDPSRTEARLKLATVCHSIGQRQQGREHALKVLAADPASGEALIALVDCSSTAEQLKECEELINRVPAAQRGTMTVHIARAALFAKQNDPAAAEAQLQKASALEPKSQRPYYALYALYAAQQQPEKATAALEKAVEVAPLRSVERLRYAQLKLQSGQAAEAKQIATEMTQKVPDFVPAWVFLARTAFQERNYEGCASLLTNILSADASNYEAHGLNGELMLLRGDSTNAVRQFEWLIQQYGTNTEHYYNLARAQVQSGQENQAIGSLDRAILAYSNNVPAILLQSSLLLRRGSFDRTAVTLKSVAARAPTLRQSEQAQLPHVFMLLARAQAGMKNYSEAAATYQMVSKSFPGLLEMHLEAAAGLASVNRNADAIKAYSEYVRLSTNSFGLVRAGRGLAFLNDFAEARGAYEKARSITPDYMPALEAMIHLDLRQKRYDVAIEEARREIQQQRAGGMPYLMLGTVYIERAIEKAREAGAAREKEHLLSLPAVQEDVKLAEEALQQAIKIDPGLGSAFRLLAKLHVSSGRHTEALRELEGLVARTNDATAYVQMALIHSQAKEHKTAAALYEKAIEFAPRSVEILNNLAVLYSDHVPRYDRAVELAKRARRITPDSPAVADTLGWALYRQGEYPQALPLLEYAAKVLPHEPEVQFHLGMTYYMLGYEQASQVALETATALSDVPFKSEATACLAVLAVDPASASKAGRAGLEKRLAEKPSDVVALSRLAAILEKEGSYKQAIEKHQEVLKWSPKNVGAMLNIARIYSDHLNELEQAMASAKLARNNAPGDPTTAHLLGRLALRSRNWTWAADLLAEAARKLPDDPTAVYDLAWANYFLGKVADAQSGMRRVSEHGGFENAAEARLFLTLATVDDPTEAEKVSGAASEKLKNQKDPYLPALMILSLAEEHRGNYVKAAETYAMITKQWPLFSPALRNLALISFEHLKDEKTAYDFAQKARGAYPSDARLAKALGIICTKKGEHSRGVQLLRQASLTRADDGELFYYLGVAQRETRAYSESKQSFEKALSLKLNDELAAKATQELATNR